MSTTMTTSHVEDAKAAVDAFDEGEIGRITVLAWSAGVPTSEQAKEAFNRVFFDAASRAAESGNSARATCLFRCLCDHVLTNVAWWQIRDDWASKGLDVDLLCMAYEFPCRDWR